MDGFWLLKFFAVVGFCPWTGLQNWFIFENLIWYFIQRLKLTTTLYNETCNSVFLIDWWCLLSFFVLVGFRPLDWPSKPTHLWENSNWEYRHIIRRNLSFSGGLIAVLGLQREISNHFLFCLDPSMVQLKIVKLRVCHSELCFRKQQNIIQSQILFKKKIWSSKLDKSSISRRLYLNKLCTKCEQTLRADVVLLKWLIWTRWN